MEKDTVTMLIMFQFTSSHPWFKKNWGHRPWYSCEPFMGCIGKEIHCPAKCGKAKRTLNIWGWTREHILGWKVSSYLSTIRFSWYNFWCHPIWCTNKWLPSWHLLCHLSTKSKIWQLHLEDWNKIKLANALISTVPFLTFPELTETFYIKKDENQNNFYPEVGDAEKDQIFLFIVLLCACS